MPVDANWLRPLAGELGPGINAFMTTRGFNCGRKAGDLAEVQANRAEVARLLGARPIFLDQVHGADVVRLAEIDRDCGALRERLIEAAGCVGGAWRAVAIAKWLKKHVGQVVGGRRLERVGGKGESRWRLAVVARGALG